MIFDVFRIFRQRKPVHCYFVIVFWFILLITAVYKFVRPKRAQEPVVSGELFHNLALDVKTRKIFTICNLPDDIRDGDEGNLDLEALFIHNFVI